MYEPILKPKDKPRRKEPNPKVYVDGRVVFRKPSKKWDEQRLAVYTRDRGRCVKCGPKSSVLYFNGGDWFNTAHIDHIEEKRMGGGFTDDREQNLQTLCPRHHQEKHDKSPKADTNAERIGVFEAKQQPVPQHEVAVQGKAQQEGPRYPDRS